MYKTYETDNILEKKRLRAALFLRFDLSQKLLESKEHPNAYIGYDDDKVIYHNSENDITEYEEYRAIDNYGHTCLQFRQDSKSCLINLNCFPEGTAHVNYGCLMITDLQPGGTYHTTIVLANNSQLTQINKIYRLDTEDLSIAHIDSCLDMIKDELAPTSFKLLKEYLQVIETILSQTLPKLPEQL